MFTFLIQLLRSEWSKIGAICKQSVNDANFSGPKYETLTVVSGYKVYMKLRIRNVERIDFMQYKCVAKNALGASDGAITLYGKKRK